MPKRKYTRAIQDRPFTRSQKKLCNAAITPLKFLKSDLVTSYVTSGIMDRNIKITRLAPFITIMDNFLTMEECRAYIATAKNWEHKFEKCLDFSPDMMSTTMSACTSKILHLEYCDVFKKLISPFFPGIERKHIKMKRYTPSESSIIGITDHIDDSEYTLLIYLNDVAVESGGSTVFPFIELDIQPRAGRAIWFHTRTMTVVEKNLTHRGEPLVSGEKYIIQAQGSSF
jgi:hypothetical protein